MAATATLALADLAATRAFAHRVARILQPGDIIGLAGPLGAGKTELARAMIRSSFGAELEVPSPTFTLVQDYPAMIGVIRHIDLYRIAGAEDLIELGLDMPAADEIWLVEWPERAGDFLSADRLDLRLEQGPQASARVLHLHAGAGWRTRLGDLVA